MDITNLNDEHYGILSEFKNKRIFKTVYIADTDGIAEPRNIKVYIDKLREIGYENTGFHAHNQNGQALNNSLIAVKSGISSVDVVQDCCGRNGGNLKFSDLKRELKLYACK